MGERKIVGFLPKFHPFGHNVQIISEKNASLSNPTGQFEALIRHNVQPNDSVLVAINSKDISEFGQWLNPNKDVQRKELAARIKCINKLVRMLVKNGAKSVVIILPFPNLVTNQHTFDNAMDTLDYLYTFIYDKSTKIRIYSPYRHFFPYQDFQITELSSPSHVQSLEFQWLSNFSSGLPILLPMATFPARPIFIDDGANYPLF